MFGDKFGGIVLKDDRIIHGKESVPLAGAHAVVDAAGEIDKRITATRLVLTGPFALAFRKKKDKRELYLMVEGEGNAFMVKVNPKEGEAARKFASKINAAAAKATQAAPPTSAPMDVADQLRKLAELRDSGVLSEDEFQAQKAKLLS